LEWFATGWLATALLAALIPGATPASSPAFVPVVAPVGTLVLLVDPVPPPVPATPARPGTRALGSAAGGWLAWSGSGEAPGSVVAVAAAGALADGGVADSTVPSGAISCGDGGGGAVLGLEPGMALLSGISTR